MVTQEARALIQALAHDVRAWSKADLERRWSASALRSAVRCGAVVRVVPGVYSALEHSESFATRAHAAHLWCGKDSVLIGAGAASVWEFGDVPATVLLAVPQGMKRVCPEWLTLRAFSMPIPTGFWGACPVAMPEWAAVTAYASAPRHARDGYLYRVVQARKAMPSDLLAVASQLPRLRGRRHLQQVVAAINAGSESHLETTGLRRVFNTADFDEFVRQHWVRTPGGNYRLDMFHPPSLTAVELDGAGDHRKPERRQYDVTRDVHVASVGILTLRFTAEDIERRGTWCRHAVKAVIASRS